MRLIRQTDPAPINEVFDKLECGDIAFDIGANCGQSVDRLLPRFMLTVAVEPEDHSFAQLAIKHSGTKRVALVHAACSNVDGTVNLEVREGSIQSGQLTTGDALPGWGDKVTSRPVPAVTCDQLMRDYGMPDLLKVDTEGHEAFVLRGAEDVLKTHPYVIIEVHSAPNGRDCQRILKKAHYDNLEIIRHEGYPEDSWLYRSHYWLVGT